jgi:ABC-2 type transport system ATP-binding protein
MTVIFVKITAGPAAQRRGPADYVRGTPPPTLQPIASPLRITELTKRFGDKLALDELTLTVSHGACSGLVGPNGSGKSTTMRTVIGLARPDSGTVEVCGLRTDQDIIGVRRLMGVMLDPLQIFDRLSAREFVATIGELRQLDRDVVATRSTEMFEVLEVTDDADRPIASYSHGMRKKTALIAALLHRPRLIMLDEPFEGVDPVSTRTMRAMLDRFRAGGGTVILSTHVMDVVERVCTHIGVIRDGRIVISGPIEEIRAGRRLEDAFIDAVGAVDVSTVDLDWLG